MQHEDIERIARLMTEEVGGVIDINTILTTYPSVANILDQFGIKPETLKDIGSGSNGTAYSDGKFVVKLTTDRSEAHSSHNIAGKNVPGVAKIYATYSLAEKGLGEPYYLIIQDLTTTQLNQTERDVADQIGHFIIAKNPFTTDVRTATKDFFNWLFQKTGKNYIDPTATNLVQQVIVGVQNLYKNGVRYFDVDSSNLGKDAKGNYIIFDLGVSETNEPSIEVVESLLDGRELPTIF